MTRTRASAKAAGSRFERQVADYLAEVLDDDRIDRRVTTGARDKGDIAGIRIAGHRAVIECKNHTRLDLAGWHTEATNQAANDDAALGIIVHKRHGVDYVGKAWVTMTLADLAWLIRTANAANT